MAFLTICQWQFRIRRQLHQPPYLKSSKCPCCLGHNRAAQGNRQNAQTLLLWPAADLLYNSYTKTSRMGMMRHVFTVVRIAAAIISLWRHRHPISGGVTTAMQPISVAVATAATHTALVTPAQLADRRSSKLKTGRPWVTPNPTRPSFLGRIR